MQCYPTPLVIDLRSDTVTQPSPAMRRAMASAVVGDDVFGEDPTVRALEERSAELLGTEAALLVSSGTMGNLVGIMAHVPRGGEIIGPAEIHTFSSEGAGHAVVAGASVRAIPPDADGMIPVAAVRSAIRDDDIHEPPTALITLENTHALSMGQPLTPAYVESIAAVGREAGVPLFIDGARMFNAAVALGVPARDLVPAGASATFCLSKSLGCPVGSVVAGDRAFIARALRARKLLGGGMRQAGIIAAAGVVALSDGPDGMIERLADDHANARLLADALASMPGITRLGPCTRPNEFRAVRGRRGGVARGQRCSRRGASPAWCLPGRAGVARRAHDRVPAGPDPGDPALRRGARRYRAGHHRRARDLGRDGGLRLALARSRMAPDRCPLVMGDPSIRMTLPVDACREHILRTLTRG